MKKYIVVVDNKNIPVKTRTEALALLSLLLKSGNNYVAIRQEEV